MIKKSNFKNKIVKELDSLNWEQQEKILDYLVSLKISEIKGTKGKDLLVFSGSIGKEDLIIMENAIVEGCEKAEPNGW